jgi:hypothetical protein
LKEALIGDRKCALLSVFSAVELKVETVIGTTAVPPPPPAVNRAY